MTIDAPLHLHRATVQQDWVDYNGHMNEAYYLLIFSHATDDFMDFGGMHAAYRKRANASVYTLETHIVYVLEVSVDEEVRVETQLLGQIVLPDRLALEYCAHSDLAFSVTPCK